MREKPRPWSLQKRSPQRTMQKLHGALIREGTCCTAACCDYCIVGDRNPIAAEYELKRADNGLWISVKKEA